MEKSGDDTEYQQKVDLIENGPRRKLNDSKLRKIANSYKLYTKLESTSKVPAVNSKDPVKERRKTIYNDEEKLKKFWQDKKNLIEEARKVKAKNQEANNDPKLRFVNNYDLWDEVEKDESEGNDYVPKKREIKVPEHLRQKPSLLPAVEAPLPGQSYNPDEEEHRKLIMKAVSVEVEKLNKDIKLTNSREKYFVPKEQANNEQAWIEEMSQGLGLSPEEEQEDEEEIEDVLQFTKQVSREKKKTKSQRRREAREKAEKIEKETEKKLKMKENQIFKIKSIKKELGEREKRLAERAKRRDEKYVQSLYQPKRLSRFRFEEAPIEVNLTNEISGNLRSTKVEGNLLLDRFKSFQKRNLIEPRVRQLRKRKYKLKAEMKKRHKATVQ